MTKTVETLLRFCRDPHISRLTNAVGRLAQLVERLVYTEDVGSSSLSSPTILFLFHIVFRSVSLSLLRAGQRFGSDSISVTLLIPLLFLTFRKTALRKPAGKSRLASKDPGPAWPPKCTINVLN